MLRRRWHEKVSPWVGPFLYPVWRGAVGVKDACLSAYERENGELKRDAAGDPIFSFGRLGRVFATAAMIGVSGSAACRLLISTARISRNTPS